MLLFHGVKKQQMELRPGRFCIPEGVFPYGPDPRALRAIVLARDGEEHTKKCEKWLKRPLFAPFWPLCQKAYGFGSVSAVRKRPKLHIR